MIAVFSYASFVKHITCIFSGNSLQPYYIDVTSILQMRRLKLREDACPRSRRYNEQQSQNPLSDLGRNHTEW